MVHAVCQPAPVKSEEAGVGFPQGKIYLRIESTDSLPEKVAINMANNDNKETGSENELDLPAEMFQIDDDEGVEVGETVIQMPHRRPGFRNPTIFPVTVKYSTVDDMAMFEGDIVLGDLEDIESAVESRGIGIKDKKFRWPDGIIPYVTQEIVQDRVEAAIEHWEANTPIRFKKREETDEDFISFESRRGCWSKVGRHGGEQVISLGIGCSVGSAIHEIGHALGLWHEQSRSDRDDFVEIILENVRPKARHNFDKHIQDGIDLGDYDFGSIMHYPSTAFGDGLVTIRTKNGEDIGQRNGLSKGDIAAIRMLYPKLDWPDEEEE